MDEDLELFYRNIDRQEHTAAVSEQIKRIKAIESQLAAQVKLSELERIARIRGDAEERQFTVKWNRINLTVAILGVLFGCAGFVVALIALLAR